MKKDATNSEASGTTEALHNPKKQFQEEDTKGLEMMQDRAIEVLHLSCDKHKLQTENIPSVQNIQEDGFPQHGTAPDKVQPDTVDDVLKWVTDSPVNVISPGWINKVKQLNDIDRAAIKAAIKGKTGASLSILNQQINNAIKVWKKEEAKALNQKITTARKNKRIVEIDYDPAHTGIVTVKAAKAIVNNPDQEKDTVFKYGNTLASIQVGHPTTVRGLMQLSSNIKHLKMSIVKTYNTITMRHRLEQSAVYIIKNKDTPDVLKPWTKDIVDGLFSQTEVKFPILTGIIQHPFVSFNGELFTKQGYDKDTGLYVEYDKGLSSILIQKPTQKDVGDALGVLCDKVFADFPFVEKADKISAIAVLLTAIQRKMIIDDSGCPGFLVDAPTQSTGKTTLAQIISYPIFGRSVSASSWSDNDTEMAKLLLAILLEGHGCVLFDNLPAGTSLKSNELAKAMTGNSYSGRVLGKNKTATVPSNTVWIFTGNNISICGDFNTRVIPIRLDSRCADPDRRSYTRLDIGKWCLEHRAEIIKACLILVMADCSQLSKDVKPTRYPDWDQYVRLPLLAASGIDVADKFQQNKQADPEIEIKLNFLKTMFEEFGSRSITTKEIIQVTADAKKDISKCMGDIFPAGSPSAQQLGKWMGGFKSQILGGYRLTSSKGTSGATKNRTIWKICLM